VSEILLVENSESMKNLQAEKLQELVEEAKWNLSWKNNIDEVENSEQQYTMVIAHEFFDALPFHLLQVCHHH
jgi:NADH dehydrogenase [ubiquinone] 1 alpha subcomplex assembly factor 7